MLMTPFVVTDGNFNGTQDFLAHLADRRTQHGDSFRRVPIEDGQKSLMGKVLVGV